MHAKMMSVLNSGDALQRQCCCTRSNAVSGEWLQDCSPCTFSREAVKEEKNACLTRKGLPVITSVTLSCASVLTANHGLWCKPIPRGRFRGQLGLRAHGAVRAYMSFAAPFTWRRVCYAALLMAGTWAFRRALPRTCSATVLASLSFFWIECLYRVRAARPARSIISSISFVLVTELNTSLWAQEATLPGLCMSALLRASCCCCGNRETWGETRWCV